MVDGTVEIRLAEYFERPLRLTPRKVWRCWRDRHALLSVPGSDPHGPLATTLDKLDVVLDAADGPAVHVEEATISKSYRLRPASVEIDYSRPARHDEITTRIVDPWHVTRSAPGIWRPGATGRTPSGLSASIALARGPPGEHFEEPELATSESGERAADAAELVYRPRPEHLRVSLRLAPSADWVVESFPHEAAEHSADGSWAAPARSARPPGWSASCSRSGRTSPWRDLLEAARVAPDAGAHSAPLPLRGSLGAASGSGASERDDGAVEQRL